MSFELLTIRLRNNNIVFVSFIYSFTGQSGTLGTQFVFNFPMPFDPVNSPTVLISTPSLNPVSVSVSVPGIGFYTQNIITRDQHAEVVLPSSAYLELVSYSQNKTVVVSADDKVSVYGVTSYGYHGDGFVSLPTNALGKKYMVVTYGPTFSSSKPSEFSISALEDETDIQINLPDSIQNISVTLKAYQSYQFYDGYNDLTGSVIDANKPIAVLAGVELADVPDGNGPDGLLEMLPSVDSFGSNFILAPFKNRTQGYVYRVITPTKVNISISGIGYFHDFDLDAGQMYEGDVLGDAITLITSDKPVLIMQYMKGDRDDMGDAAMIIVPPKEMFAGNVTFPVYDSPYYSDYRYYINIVSECSDGQGLMYDDTLLDDGFDTISRNGMCAFRSEVNPGTHSVGHINSDATFAVLVYGFMRYYGIAYPAGYNVLLG